MKNLLVSVALGAGLLGTQASAASCDYVGDSHSLVADNFHSIGISLCSTHFPLGSDAYNAVVWALQEYNSIQGSDISFHIAGLVPHTNYSNTLDNDGINKVDINTCTVSDCSYTGRTMSFSNIWGRVNEFDITFKDTVSWWWDHPYSWDFTGDNFRNTFLHELGHGLGFDHTASFVNAPNVMGGKIGGWLGYRQSGLKAFDHGHVRYHYPDGSSTAKPDLVLGNYRTEPTWNATELKWTYPLVMNEQIAGGTEVKNVVEVRAGDTVTLTWTRMNTGKGAVTANYDTTVFASTNDFISTADIPLKSWVHSGTVAESSTLYASTNLTIPSSLAVGTTYYVGMIIDVNHEVSENDEGNNVLVFEKRLEVVP
ncbi:MAG TPA: hypothetical protein VLQ93_13740 [Myxococcaceae bacterium]|nr:hypothetical protein [Myxococcaceae bacterium]